jgi:predicted acylesterase/phospholipase RssA
MDSPPRTRFFTSCVAAFQGGGCRAAALVGAVEEALGRGVNFVEFAGTSAGSIVAALMGAGASISDLKQIVSSIDFAALFMAPPENIGNARPRLPIMFRGLLGLSRFTHYRKYRPYFFHLGLHSSAKIESWMNIQLQELLQLKRKVLFSDLIFPTWVVATDVLNKDVRVWSKHKTPTDEVAKAVRASCSIPGYFQPVEKRYVDGGVLSNLPTFVYAQTERPDYPLSTRVLGFTLIGDKTPDDQQDAFSLVQGIVDTVIDGASEVQLRSQPNVHVIPIPTGDIGATDIDKMKEETVAILINNGKVAAQDFFEQELLKFRSTERADPLCRDLAEMYSAIVQNLDNAVQDILISCTTSDWIYKLFPAFLMWTAKKLHIRVLLPMGHQRDLHEQYRRRLLRYMGVLVHEVTNVATTAFIFDGNDATRASAVIGITGPDTRGAAGISYSAPYDSGAITALYEQIFREFPVNLENSVSLAPDLKKTDEASLLSILRQVRQYGSSEVRLSLQEVPLDSLFALRPYVNDYKYRQAEVLNGLYRSKSIPLFAPAEVSLNGTISSLAVPPVVEKSGTKHVLIEGTARAVFCFQHRKEEVPEGKLLCVVAEGVREPLPSTPVELRYVLPVTRNPGVSVDYRYFRPIELVAHPTDSLK